MYYTLCGVPNFTTNLYYLHITEEEVSAPTTSQTKTSQFYIKESFTQNG